MYRIVSRLVRTECHWYSAMRDKIDARNNNTEKSSYESELDSRKKQRQEELTNLEKDLEMFMMAEIISGKGQ